MARQPRGRAPNQGLLVAPHTRLPKEAEGCSEWIWRTQCRALLICPARSPLISLPPLDPYIDIHQLQRAQPLQCYLWLSRLMWVSYSVRRKPLCTRKASRGGWFLLPFNPSPRRQLPLQGQFLSFSKQGLKVIRVSSCCHSLGAVVQGSWCSSLS